MSRYDITTLKSRLNHLKIEDNPALVQQKSRDFYWYSPTLKRQLADVNGDAVVAVTCEQDVIATLAACYTLGIPVTPRGTGTGNYGQAMPLSGGVVLDLSGFNQVTAIAPGRFISGPGAIIEAIDHATRAHSSQECRLHPSTYATASIGGFIAGGSGGVGSIQWGGLRDWGNIIRLKVVTMEASPRVLELTGADLHKVSHAYGTNGIITEVEMPLAPAYDWIDVIIGFDGLERAAAYANMLGEQDGLLLKQLAVVASPVPHDYFLRHKKFIPREKTIVALMVARHALDALLALTATVKGAAVLMNAALLSPEDRKGLPPCFELGWNHTTLRALRVDPAITYLQALYPFPNQLKVIEAIHRHTRDQQPKESAEQQQRGHAGGQGDGCHPKSPAAKD
ncbi:MAG: FAD-binding oxidoreductase [Beijerinckiaceae bacterium]